MPGSYISQIVGSNPTCATKQSMKKTVTMIDPPSGWMYGFPKAVPDDVDMFGDKLIAWLIEEGYPSDKTELLNRCRYWQQEIEEE